MLTAGSVKVNSPGGRVVGSFQPYGVLFSTMSAEQAVPLRAGSLRGWYHRPLGQLLAEAETGALADQLPGIFGYHLLVVDPPWDTCSLEDSRIPHHVIQRVQADADDPPGMIGHTDAWPVMTDTLDAIVLPHSLELSHDPHQVLREADRCLIPDGHLILFGFNPRSLWGVRRFMARGVERMPWGMRFISMSRAMDWLKLLGFDTLHCRYLLHRPPVQNIRMLERLRFLEPSGGSGRMLLAGAYMLVARKRTVILTPIKARRSARRQLFPVRVPGPTQRHIRRVR
jgi:SAM-dependent methyltransferase